MQDNMSVELATKKDILKDLKDVQAVFDRFGVRIFITYGAVLGWYRDKDFLPGDDDIDMAVVDKVDFKTKKAIGWTLYNLGFEPQPMMFNVPNSLGEQMETQEVGYNGTEETGIIVCKRNFNFTIFFFQKEDCDIHGEEYVCIPKLGAMKLIATPTRFFEKPAKLKIGKKKYLVPAPIEDYLAFSYFDNWKDKTDRRHSNTYFEAHNTQDGSINLEGKNAVVKYENT